MSKSTVNIDVKTLHEIVSRKEAKLRTIQAGAQSDAAVKKMLGKIRDRKGQSFSAERTTKKLITEEGVFEIQTSFTLKTDKDRSATSLQDALARSKSYKSYIKDVNGKKQFVFLSWQRIDRETKEALESPIPMINVNNTGRVPFSPAHAIQFDIEMA